MTDRDRLIELVDKAKEEYANDVTDHTETDYIVECLLNNGVIVPPCYIGQIVYQLYRKYNGDSIVREGKVSAIQQKADKSWKIRITMNSYVFEITPDKIGERIFLTKEEAEEKLKECAE